MPDAAPSPPRRRRPADRKQQIIRCASDLFHRRGYANVSTEEIAAGVGITAGALYRHFRNKQEILTCAIEAAVDGAWESTEPDTGDLDGLIEHLSRMASPHRALGVLWQREARHLEPATQERLRHRPAAFRSRLTGQIAARRPDLPLDDAELLSGFVISALTSPSYHSVQLDVDAEVQLLRRCGTAVVTAPMLTAGPQTPVAQTAIGLAHHSRHESLIAAASRLFFQRGYRAVTMDEIGAAVGITSAAVYKYFQSKPDLLNAVVARAAAPLQLGLSHALAQSSNADEALELALDAYIEFATEHRHLIGILVAEVTNLPAPLRRTVRRQQADYVAEWVRLLRESRPELDAASTRYLVQAVLMVVNDATRSDRLVKRPDLEVKLRTVCRQLLAVHP